MSLSCKTFEVRDRATFIPCFGVLCRPERPEPDGALIDYQGHQTQQDAYLLRRAGYGADVDPPCVLFGALHCDPTHYDPYAWGANPRTMRAAHEYVTKHWDELESGAVIDVEFVLGETSESKQSEWFWCPNVDVESLRAMHSPPPGTGKVSFPEIDLESLEQRVKEKLENAEPGEPRVHRGCVTGRTSCETSNISEDRVHVDIEDTSVYDTLAKEFGTERHVIKTACFAAMYQPDSQAKVKAAGGTLNYLRDWLCTTVFKLRDKGGKP